MRIKKILLTIGTASLLMIYGCTKEQAPGSNNNSNSNNNTNNNNNNNTNQQVHCYVTQETDNGELYRSYAYNGSNRITKINQYTGTGTIKDFWIVSYNSAGRISKITVNDTFGIANTLITPAYNQDGTVSKVVWQGIGSNTDNSTYVFQYSAGKLVKKSEYWNRTETDYLVYTYDGSGNISSIATYVDNSGTPDMVQTEERRYDDKNAPVTAVDKILDTSLLNHNIISATVKDINGDVQPDNSYTVAYTYTTEDMPDKSIMTYVSGDKHTYGYTYNCK